MTDQPLDNHIFFDLKAFKPVSVGQRLRNIRKEKGFSIKALAAESGLAVNTLSLIENEKTSPSVSTLEQLAETLEIPLALLFEPIVENQHIIATRAGHRRQMHVDDIRVEDCGIDLYGQPIQPFVVTLPEERDSGPEPIFHTGHEFVYLQSGTMNYEIEGVIYSLSAGDSLFFDARLPHRWENRSDKPAVYLLVLVPGEKQTIAGENHFSSALKNK